MPVTYRIDKTNGIIYTHCIGEVTLREVIDHFRTLENDPECPDRLDVLLDLTQQTTLPRTEELQEVAVEISRVRGRVQFGACAIIVTNQALFGMLRMFEVFVEQHFRESYVFRTTHEAETWLASKRPTTSEAS